MVISVEACAPSPTGSPQAAHTGGNAGVPSLGWDPARREQLILQYTPLVKHIVARLGPARYGVLDTDDLVAAGTVGLVEAIDRFNPEIGVKFETFAYLRIRGAVLDQVRALDWVPPSVRQRNRALAAARARFETEHGRVPAEAELAEALGLDVRQYRQYQAAHGGTPAALLSLDAPLETAWSEGDEPLSLADTIAGNTPDPMRSLEESELHAMLVEGLRSLPQRDRVLLSLYYERELTMKEISVVLGVSEPRVCQLHARALQRLRLQLAERPGDA